MLPRTRLLGFLFGVVIAGAAARATAWVTTQRYRRKLPPLQPSPPTKAINDGVREKRAAGR